ncbi:MULTISPECIES: DUF84 family protein [Psychrobacillus]|uniref:inosine/xanthosine triphosphatase n=1 Tax=Psychrobacillus faecigallinarum TaxID=2762235 RepID=A0ABR8R6Q2_9BACI|nr:DUF84 family protein [Psychrobacillus faecigallinarum]MBD7943478.1 DUF84 family protein [Psychrobacillus faecigallinarum]QGM29510.1 DUF84 family protein [Bacillus sp. N3536]
MHKILIGTNNRAKTKAVEVVAGKFYPDAIFVNQEVSSQVSNQPMSNEETRQGAINRAKRLMQDFDGTFGIGLEGGVQEISDTMYVCNWGALATKTGEVFTATGAGVALPKEIADSLKEGAELGPIMDVYTNKKGIRHHEGAIGVFTNGFVKRSDMFEHIMLLLIGQYELSLKTQNAKLDLQE